MKRISADYRKGFAKVEIESADDLWYLSQVIDSGDLISGRTLRKIKTSASEDAKNSAVKKPVFIKIRAEKVEFSTNQAALRILGSVVDGPEDIPRGEHHSFVVEAGTQLTIEKDWLSYQIHRMDEAFSSKRSPILITVFDREEAYFAMLNNDGYEVLSSLKGNVEKKGMDSTRTSNFYHEIIVAVKEYDSRHHFDHIIMGSPAFWKDELLKNLDDESLRKKMIMAVCSSVSKAGINEVLKRDEIRSALSSDRATTEIHFVEDLMKEISKQGKAAYGISEVESALMSGAIETLLVTDTYIQKCRANATFPRLESIMKTADRQKTALHIISSSHEGGKKLDGLGGIGAILRYTVYH